MERFCRFKSRHSLPPVPPGGTANEIRCVRIRAEVNPPLHHEAGPEGLRITASKARGLQGGDTVASHRKIPD